MKQQFLKNTPDTFKVIFYENNRRVIPASALLSVCKPGQTMPMIDEAAMSIGADGTVSYELNAGDNFTLGADYRARIAYVVNSLTYFATLYYDVVISKPRIIITDADIVAELPQLKDSGWKVHGRADSGTATSIVDAELKRYEDNYFTGGLACSLDKGEEREIIGFVSSTGTVTTAPFTSAVAVDRYVLTRSFLREINRAFEKIEDMLNRNGKRAHLVLDPYDLRELHIYLSVAEVCRGLVTTKDNIWWGLWKEYEKKAGERYSAMTFKYDASGDGLISGGETETRNSWKRVGRG